VHADDDRRSQTIKQFCATENISLASFYELSKRGLTPEVLEVPGTKIRRITPEARDAWRARMTELSHSKAAKLERARRRQVAVIAGQKSAASEKHVSKRKARSEPAPQHDQPPRRRGRR
jgi:hypothetical protein